MEGDAAAGALGERLAPQPDFSRTSSSTPRMRAGVEAVRCRAALRAGRSRGVPSRSSRNCSGSLPAACASSSMNDWIDEREARCCPARAARRSARRAASARREREVRHEAAPGTPSPGCWPTARTARPRRSVTKWFRHATSLPDASTPPFRKWKPAGTIEVVAHVVFARPQQLHRRAADCLRDPRRFDHVVVRQAPAEAAAAAEHVQRDVALGHAERLRAPARVRSAASGSAPRSRACRP